MYLRKSWKMAIFHGIKKIQFSSIISYLSYHLRINENLAEMRKLKENLAMWIILLCFSSVQGQDLYGIFQDENMDWKITSVGMGGEFIDEHFIGGLDVYDPWGGSCIDPSKKVMHFVGYDDLGVQRYYTVDVTDGTVIYSPEVNGIFGVRQMSWNPNDSLIYGVLKTQGSGIHKVVVLNAMTGETESVKHLPLIEFYLSGSYIDSEENRLIFIANNFADAEGEFRMYSIDLTDTNQSFDTLCDFQDPYYFTGLTYVYGESYSVGILREGDLPNFQDNIARLDNVQGSISNISALNNIIPLNFEFIFQHSLGMVFIGNYTSDNDSASRIMAVDIQTGEITSNAQLPHRLRNLEYMESEVFVAEMMTQAKNTKLWPIPATKHLQVTSDSEISTFTICDMSGQVIKHGGADGKQFSIDLSSFQNGVYRIIFQTNRGITEARKLVVQN